MLCRACCCHGNVVQEIVVVIKKEKETEKDYLLFQNTEKETIKVYSLPSNATERERWMKVLPNVLSKCPTMDVVACV